MIIILYTKKQWKPSIRKEKRSRRRNLHGPKPKE
jgi:hypothetical protein